MSGGEGRLHLHGRLHDLLKRPIDPVPNPDFLLVGLDVDVGDALQDRVGEETVDELHHRGLVDLGLQGGDGDVLLLILQDLDFLIQEVAEHLLHLRLAKTVVVLQVLLEGVLPHDHRFDLVPGDELQIVDGPHVGGIGHGDGEGPSHLPQGENPVLHRHFFRHQLQDLLFDLDLVQVHGRNPELFRQGPSELVLSHEPQLHQGETDAGLRLLSFLQGLLKLFLGDEAFSDKKVA